MIIITDKKITQEELKKASEEFKTYIKIVIDLEKEILGAGSKLHADIEKLLLASGSSQQNIWGGGYDIETGKIDTQAMINIRPNDKNEDMNILDPIIRAKFFEIANKLLI